MYFNGLYILTPACLLTIIIIIFALLEIAGGHTYTSKADRTSTYLATGVAKQTNW